VDKAQFYATCPRCRTANVVELRGTRWLQEVAFRCVKCGHGFDVELTLEAVLESCRVGSWGVTLCRCRAYAAGVAWLVGALVRGAGLWVFALVSIFCLFLVVYVGPHVFA